MNFSTACIQGCTPPQIINLTLAINDISSLKIYDDCNCEYDMNSLKYSYSLDGACWTCYMSYKEILTNTIELKQDFFIRIEIAGIIGKITLNDEIISDYSTELKGCFTFDAAGDQTGSTYNPYSNMDNAIALGQQLAESVSQMIGIPCYYIKLKPNEGGKDLTFKEYTLLNVEAVKQVKIVIQDNMMPSSKPEFSDWGLDWQTDWEVEVTKGSFATAFGNFAQPMEGDLVYIPMMKRMWMVNGAYEEKKDGFMWIATTFKLALVKYQEKDSVDLGDAQSFVDSVVKNKYEDLFGEDENTTLDSGEASTDAPKYAADKLYTVYESDATRKYVTCDTIDIIQNNIYIKGVLVSDLAYKNILPTVESTIVYQRKYCGDELAISFIANFELFEHNEGTIIEIGHIKIKYVQDFTNVSLYISTNPDQKITITTQNTYFIMFRWSKNANIIDAAAYKYEHNENIPLYKLTSAHYYFDMDNSVSSFVTKFNIELVVPERSDVKLHGIYQWITNFKLFDLYNDNISELLRMYPTNQHLLINDTARRIADLPGVKL